MNISTKKTNWNPSSVFQKPLLCCIWILLLCSAANGQEQMYYNDRIQLKNQDFYHEVIYPDAKPFKTESLIGFWRLSWYEEEEGRGTNHSTTYRVSTNQTDYFGHVNSIILHFTEDSMFLFLYPFHQIIACKYKAVGNRLNMFITGDVEGACKFERNEGGLLLSYKSQEIFYLDQYYKIKPSKLDLSEVHVLESHVLNMNQFGGEYRYRESCDPENTIQKIRLSYTPPQILFFSNDSVGFSCIGNVISCYDKATETEYQFEYLRHYIGNGADSRLVARIFLKVLSPEKYKDSGLVYDKMEGFNP